MLEGPVCEIISKERTHHPLCLIILSLAAGTVQSANSQHVLFVQEITLLLPFDWQDSSGDELLDFVKKVFNLLDFLIKIFTLSKAREDDERHQESRQDRPDQIMLQQSPNRVLKLRDLRTSMVTLQKEVISAMLSVEEQQQQVTLQKLILMVSVYIAEIAPQNLRGRVASVNQLSVTIWDYCHGLVSTRVFRAALKKTEQVQQMIKDQAKEYYENKAVMQKQEELWQTERSLLVRDITDALKIIDQLKVEQMKLEEVQFKDEEIRRLKAQLQEKKDKETEVQFKNEEIKKLKAQLQERKEEVKVQFSEEEFPPLGSSQIARPFMEAEIHHFGNATSNPKVRKVTNQLYNVKVEFDIPDCSAFGTTAIIDTGASACCINKKVVPKEALEPLTDDVFFNGLNSRQQATHKIKQGNFLIEGNKFRIPLIYAFDMNDSNGIEMLIGANFLRSMKEGIRIEGDEITIYKKITKIKTSNQTEIAEIAEL
nr:SH3 domain-containing protein 1 isoform X1 [Tanacetum cinerariifolium]